MTNSATTVNIREIRHEIATLAGDLGRIIRDGNPSEEQRESVENARRLLQQARDVLAPAEVEHTGQEAGDPR